MITKAKPANFNVIEYNSLINLNQTTPAPGDVCECLLKLLEPVQYHLVVFQMDSGAPDLLFLDDTQINEILNMTKKKSIHQ
jgi:hypothetical protein